MTNYKEYIYAVYQEKSFSKAAQRLYVSQPWLSATVKKVEQELGLSLFDRSTKPISLTEAGLYYIEQVERIMAIEEEMQAHFRSLKNTGQVKLHIGSSMFFCTYVLPVLMEDFRLQCPQVTLTFTEGDNKTLLEKLLNGRLDFLLEAECPEDPKVQTIPWASEELVLAVPSHYRINQTLSKYCYSFEEFLRRGHPDHKRPAIPLKAFQGESFILLKEGTDSHNRSFQFCENAGFTPEVSMYCAQMMTAYYLVCEGRGITFLRSTIPEYVSPTDRVVFYQPDDPLTVRNIYLSYLKKKSGTVQRKLINFILEQGSLAKSIGN